MVFNKSWAFLKSLEDEEAIKETKEYMDMMEQARRAQLFPNHPEYTIENNFQTKLPMHDPKLDYTTGWEGWEPVRAVRVQSEEFPAGQPVPQDGSNINYEEGDPRLPPLIPKIPHDDDPVWNDPNSRWSKDPISNVPYYMAGANRDGKYHPRARKLFAGLKNAKAGTWVSNNTMGDINNLYTHNTPEKLVYIRGNLDKYGKVHRRDSDEAKEDLAEAFIEHNKNIPRESLVEVPLRRHYRDQTLQMGTPNLGRNISNTDRMPSGRISRWSDKPLPWGKPVKRKKIEDMDEDEFHNLFHGKTKDEIYELQDGDQYNFKNDDRDSPMKKAFQLLKGSTKQSTLWGYDPKIVNSLLAEKNSNIFIAAKPGSDAMPVNEQNRLSDAMLQELTKLKEKHGDFDITSATGRAGWEAEPSFMLTNLPDTARDAVNEIAARYKQDSLGVSERGEQGVNYVTPEGKTVKDGKFSGMEIQENPEYSTDFPSGQRLTFTNSEPMNIAFQLLKERKSPAAFAHKLEYDKQYQKDPKRVKYREQLNTERRKRGIYGKGGKDVSHTQGGKLTLESAHSNRARHFKNKGTLRRVKVKK